MGQNKYFLDFIHAYAISKLFHSPNKIKYLTSHERALFMANKTNFDNLEANFGGAGYNGLDPNDASNNGRRVLRSTSFGRQIRNIYDVIAANDLLNPRVLSTGYGGWDSHGAQRQVPSILASDPNNPFEGRGIESGLKDIFGGQFGSSPADPSALHSGFSALWESLSTPADQEKLVLTIAGEFGRQIRDNGDRGTDHGKGNFMLVISDAVQGGVYGEMFPDDEVDKYDNQSLNTPDIDQRSEIDSFFSKVADWVAPGSASADFPRTDANYSGEAPSIESLGLFDNLTWIMY